MSRYWLPCPCGAKLRIEKAQAGQTVRCECGRSLPAPTIREFSQLEPAEDDADARATTPWTPRKGVLLLGALLVVLGGVGYAVLHFRQPVNPAARIAEDSVASWSASQKLAVWNQLRAGPAGINHQAMDDFAAQRQTNQERRWLAAGGAVLGVLLIAGALLAPRPRRTAP